MKLTRTAAVLAAALTVTLAGCSAGYDDTTPVVYPTAYGEGGHCYFVDSPAEAIALQAAGLCPVGWTPMVAPGYWRNEYAGFYASPIYVSHYVPVSRRTTYVSVQKTYITQHQGEVRAAASKVSASRAATTTRVQAAAKTGDNRSTYTGTTRTTTQVKTGTSGSTFKSSRR